MKKTIIWFRNDLRLFDNPCLEYADQNNHQVIFLYILDKDFEMGSASKWFLHQSLDSLTKDLKKKYNADLILKTGKSQDILEELSINYEINTILYNRVYEPEVIKRDIKIKAFFKEKDFEVKSFNASLLFEPWAIKNLSNSYFKVFTPFWRKCLSEFDKITKPILAPKSIEIIKIEDKQNLDNLKLLPKKPNWAKNWHNLWKVSEEEAHNYAHNFVENRIINYKQDRDFPSKDGTSNLSPYLHFGLISSKQIYYKSLPYIQESGAQCFLSEIGWREFSHHLLYNFEDLPSKNFKPKFNDFRWQNNEEYLKKWQKGQTGYPVIDAGMRQLQHTGWMHNRVRMIVASFLIKNLLIDWRIGQKWFFDCLVDADLAANSASWQWVAGSGADSSPYFRIFNPLLQSNKFDASGSYIRKWVPEIAHLDNKEIHFPLNRKNYVQPIVDLMKSRNKALEIYSSLK